MVEEVNTIYHVKRVILHDLVPIFAPKSLKGVFHFVEFEYNVSPHNTLVAPYISICISQSYTLYIPLTLFTDWLMIMFVFSA